MDWVEEGKNHFTIPWDKTNLWARKKNKTKKTNERKSQKKKARHKRLSRGQTSEWLKKSKRTFNCCCWGPLSLSRLMCDQSASWIKMSHTLWNGQNKTGSERSRKREEEEDGETERRERVSYMAYQLCWFLSQRKLASDCAWFAKARQKNNTSLRPCFSRPTGRHPVTRYRPWLSLCSHGTLMWYALAKMGMSSQKNMK